MSQDRIERAFDNRCILIEKTVDYTEVVAAGGSGAISILLGHHPIGGFLLERAVVPGTNFAGGSLSAVVGEIGTEADPDSVASAIALHTGTEDALRQGTAGIAAVGSAGSGADIFLTLTPTGDTLEELTAGSVKVSLIYAKGDRNQAI
jgi:hypothetical protein